MEEKIKMIEKNNTWELMDKPQGKDIIGLKWDYKINIMRMALFKYTRPVLWHRDIHNNQGSMSMKHLHQ